MRFRVVSALARGELPDSKRSRSGSLGHRLGRLGVMVLRPPVHERSGADKLGLGGVLSAAPRCDLTVLVDVDEVPIGQAFAEQGPKPFGGLDRTSFKQRSMMWRVKVPTMRRIHIRRLPPQGKLAPVADRGTQYMLFAFRLGVRRAAA